ncbi:serine O-acetyltransferase [Ruminiclostridium sufflavum DSM 19573]|uniref:Serine O-acetyltransferase n=1 Tax=Ruminiclostridium sufflavum DSM 19573 TaxID=1121337 RepID=A0A318XIV3_9FIRM|nr:serine O-acetyltransferase EpsC [Ruminiclostridium sufflavum]PYG87115.1 serine O-acetyltransferase [Ruminiclostridium sufflavum DSM 19573]
MLKNIKAVIQETVNSITDNCINQDLFLLDENEHIPNRKIIIEIIRDFRRIMFPGFFGDENITLSAPDYFIGNTLNRIYERLLYQVKVALSYKNTENMSGDALNKESQDICTSLIESLPSIQKVLLKDVEAAFKGDPAAKSKEEIIFSYPGLFAIFVYRISHELYKLKVPFIPRIMTEYAHSRTGIDINPGAKIGRYFFIDHGTGVVIGETTVIGNNVKIYQGVTLGALSTRRGQQLSGVKRHPTLENNVTVYSGATILGGNTIIGEEAVIGGNAFITESVPPYTKVIVKSQKLVFSSK